MHASHSTQSRCGCSFRAQVERQGYVCSISSPSTGLILDFCTCLDETTRVYRYRRSDREARDALGTLQRIGSRLEWDHTKDGHPFRVLRDLQEPSCGSSDREDKLGRNLPWSVCFPLFLRDSAPHFYIWTRRTAGLGAGTTEAVLVVTPMEVVKIRLQAQSHSLADPLEVPKYRNAAHAVYRIVSEEGVSTLYRGVSLTALRQSTNQGEPHATFEMGLY